MTVSKGTPVTIDAASSDSMDSGMISSSQMIVTFNDPVSTLSARVIDITTASKSIDTVNSQQTIEAYGSGIDRLALVRFSSTKFLSVKAGGGGVPGIAQVLNVSGTTVTGATSLTLSDNYDPSSLVLRAVTSTTAIIFYQVSSSTTKARILSIDGSDNITEGSALEVEADAGDKFDAELFSATKAIYVFQDADDNDYLKAQLVTISGTSLSKDGSVQDINVTDSSDSTACCVAAVSSTEVVAGYSDLASGVLGCHVVTLSGSTLTPGAKEDVATGQHRWPARAVATNASTILMVGQSATVNRVTQIIKTGDTLTYTTNDFVDMTKVSGINKESLTYIADDFALATYTASTESAIIGSDSLVVSASHIWLSTDGGATYTNIGDSAWAGTVAGGVSVVPGTAYQTIFAAVGSNLYKTTNGGTAWALETAIGYEVDFIDLEKDNTTVFLAKRDAAGTNRASLWDSVGASLTHINTGKSTTGGATSGGDVV